MADPATFGDSRKAAALGAELRFTSKAVKADDALTALEKELAESIAIQRESDQEIRKMAEEEILRLTPAVEAARVTLIRSIVPPNPDDSRNAMVEIRAGTGGEEASLFASELLRAYTRFAEKKGWKHELLSLSHSDLGGTTQACVFGSEPNAVDAPLKIFVLVCSWVCVSSPITTSHSIIQFPQAFVCANL